MKRFSGFSLIELMVVLAIITIIATASVPQIQVWTARNRGNAAVSQIISDFTKAKSIAGYSVNDVGQPIGIRPQVGMMIRTTRYLILQKNAMSGAWSEAGDTAIKTARMPMNVLVDWVNGEPTNDNSGSFSPTVVFTSSGRLKKGSDNSLITNFGGGLRCGGASGIDSPINAKRVFLAVVRSMINGTDGIWYRIEIDATGEYFVCSATNSSVGGDTPPDFDSVAGSVMEF